MSKPAASADALLVHAGGSRERGEPAVLPPVLATILSSAGVPRPEDYGRGGNPTLAVLEQALGGIEAAQAVVFSSGPAASMALMLALTSDRDRIVLPRDGYYPARVLADRLRPLGAASVAVDMCDLSAVEMARATVVGSFRVGRGTQTSCQRPGGSRLPFSSPTHHAMTAGGDQPRGESPKSCYDTRLGLPRHRTVRADR